MGSDVVSDARAPLEIASDALVVLAELMVKLAQLPVRWSLEADHASDVRESMAWRQASAQLAAVVASAGPGIREARERIERQSK